MANDQEYQFNNQREAVECLIRNGVDIDDDARVILHTRRVRGLKLLAATDYLEHYCDYRNLGEAATESFLKARERAERAKRQPKRVSKTQRNASGKEMKANA